MKNFSNQYQGDAWRRFEKNHRRDEILACTISRIVYDIGLFLKLEGDIEGIVHLSDLHWTITGKEEVQKFKVGDRIRVIILSIEPELERVSLGLKQLKPRSGSERRDDPPAPTPVTPRFPRSPNPLAENAKNE
tara:strand:+ start:277 stop:675 length:399 start_codon:yes stop_codon:yes gene_type:complete